MGQAHTADDLDRHGREMRHAHAALLAAEIQAVLAAGSDVAAACDAACRLLRPFFGADHVCVATFEPATEVRHLLGCDSAFMARHEVPVYVHGREATLASVGPEGAAELFGDVELAIEAPATAVVHGQDVHSMVRASLPISGGHLAVVTVASSTPGHFTGDDAELLLDIVRPSRRALERLSQVRQMAETSATLAAQARILSGLGPGATAESLAQIFVEVARPLFGATHASVFHFVDDDPRLLALSSAHVEEAELLQWKRGTHHLDVSREPHIVADLAVTQTGKVDAESFARGIRTIMRAPVLHSDGSVAGLLTVGAPRPRAYHESHLARLVELSRAVGVVLERAELLDQARARAEQAAALTRLLGTINASAEPREVAAIFAREVIEFFGAEFVLILGFERESGRRTVIAAEPGGAGFDLDAEMPLEASSVYRWVSEHQRVTYDDRDPDASPPWLRQLCTARGIRNIVAVRLDANGEAVGIIAAGSRSGHPLGSSELRLLSELAGPLTMLLERASLVTSLEQTTRRMDSILGLMRAVGPQGSIEELAGPVAAALRQMFGADFCAVTVGQGQDMRIAATDSDGQESDEATFPLSLKAAPTGRDPLGELLRIRGFRSTLTVPLGPPGTSACAVTLASRRDGILGVAEAHQVAETLRPIEVAIGYFQGREAAAVRERRLESTNRILGRFTRGGSPREVAEAFTRECPALFDAALAVIFRFDSDGGRAEVVGLSSTVFAPGEVPETLPMDSILDQLRTAAGGPEVVGDVRDPGNAGPLQPSTTEKGLFSILRAPLALHDAPWGAVVLWARGANRFSREDAELLGALAGPLTVALEKAMALESLAESELKYRSVVAQAEEMIFLFDCETMAILDANPFAARVLGYTPEELLGLQFPDIAEDPAEATETIARILAEGDLRLTDRRYRTRTGAAIDVDVVATVVAFGGRRAVLAMARDMSDRKALQRQLVQSQKMESLGELAGAVAHDFNNLLTTILGFAGILKLAGYLEDEDRENVTLIEDAARRGADLTSRLLSFSRGGLLRFGPIDVRSIVADTLRLAEPSLHARYQVTASLPPDPVIVDGDDGQVQQALLNIILNARDAMPDGGKLDVSLSIEGRAAVLVIADNGPGMDDDVRLRAFEPFYTTKPVGSGTGLGLAIAYGIVQGHKGSIRLETAPGAGATFVIELPLSAGSVLAAEGRAPRILVVDDDDLVRRSCRRLLVAVGFDVEEAAGGAEAVAMVTRGLAFDAVLLDLVMPGMDGAQTLAEIQKVRANLPVVISSAYSADTFLAPGAVASVAAVVAKPFTPERLMAALASAGVPRPRQPRAAANA